MLVALSYVIVKGTFTTAGIMLSLQLLEHMLVITACMVWVSPPVGVEGNSTVGAESNGERVMSGESGDSWSGGVEGVGGETVVLSLEEKGGMKVTDGGEEEALLENRLGEECLEERLSERPQNCENPSPPDQDRDMEGTGGDTSSRPTIVMVPLEGSNAELRTRVIKEVRKPGRSKCLCFFCFLKNIYLDDFYTEIILYCCSLV